MFYIVLYLSAVVVANLLTVAFGQWGSVLTSLFCIALDLTARDALHDAWKNRGLGWKMAALIASGSALSWIACVGVNWLLAPTFDLHAVVVIATASLLAFAASGGSDAVVYGLLGERARLVRINGSNAVSAAVDTAVFWFIARAVFGFSWPMMLLDYGVKTFGGMIWSVILPPPRKAAWANRSAMAGPEAST